MKNLFFRRCPTFNHKRHRIISVSRTQIEATFAVTPTKLDCGAPTIRRLVNWFYTKSMRSVNFVARYVQLQLLLHKVRNKISIDLTLSNSRLETRSFAKSYEKPPNLSQQTKDLIRQRDQRRTIDLIDPHLPKLENQIQRENNNNTQTELCKQMKICSIRRCQGMLCRALRRLTGKYSFTVLNQLITFANICHTGKCEIATNFVKQFTRPIPSRQIQQPEKSYVKLGKITS